jgi:putative Holliday junction resolvase
MPRILAVDPGEARIGLAVCDPSGTIARPLRIVRHVSRAADTEAILLSARETDADRIVVGVAYGLEGAGPQARRALRLVAALRERTSIPIEAWDESGSTQAARPSRGRGDADDARAAAVILQDYLDAKSTR